MLTADDLASMRDVAEDALPDTAVIQSQAIESDDGGGFDTVWTNAGTVSCRIAPLMRQAEERETGGRVSPYAEYVVTLPFDASVTTNSRLLISGGTFNVATVRDRSWHVTTRVEVNRET